MTTWTPETQEKLDAASVALDVLKKAIDARQAAEAAQTEAQRLYVEAGNALKIATNEHTSLKNKALVAMEAELSQTKVA